MSNQPSPPAKNPRPPAAGPAPAAIRARGAARVRGRRSGRSAPIVGAIFAVLVFGIAVAATIRLAMSDQSPAPTPAVTRMTDAEIRTAKVVTDAIDDERCRQRIFDNRTGTMADSDRPCRDPEALDRNGLPIPLGTIHRLDGISKSFTNR